MATKNTIVYGRNSVEEVVKNQPSCVVKLVVLADAVTHIPKLIAEAQKNNIKIEKINNRREFENILRRLEVEDTNNQGVFAEIKQYEYFDFDTMLEESRDNALVLILSHITDVANFGAIIRSAVAFDVDFIIIPKDRSVEVTATVFKTSSGQVLKSKIVRVTNIASAINKLKENGFWIFAADGNSKKLIKDINFSGKSVLVVGSEGEGVGALVMKIVDDTFKIPISVSVESLNVSVATGICLYHIRAFSK